MDALSAVAAVLTITGVVVIAATVGEACELLPGRRRSCVACGTWGRVARWAMLAGVRRPFCAGCRVYLLRPAAYRIPLIRDCYLCGETRDVRVHGACHCGCVVLAEANGLEQMKPFDVAALGVPDAPPARFDSEGKIVG